MVTHLAPASLPLDVCDVRAPIISFTCPVHVTSFIFITSAHKMAYSMLGDLSIKFVVELDGIGTASNTGTGTGKPEIKD